MCGGQLSNRKPMQAAMRATIIGISTHLPSHIADPAEKAAAPKMKTVSEAESSSVPSIELKMPIHQTPRMSWNPRVRSDGTGTASLSRMGMVPKLITSVPSNAKWANVLKVGNSEGKGEGQNGRQTRLAEIGHSLFHSKMLACDFRIHLWATTSNAFHPGSGNWLGRSSTLAPMAAFAGPKGLTCSSSADDTVSLGTMAAISMSLNTARAVQIGINLVSSEGRGQYWGQSGVPREAKPPSTMQ